MASELEKLDNALKNVNNAVATYAAAKEAKARREYNTQVLEMSKDLQAWSKDFNERQFASSLEQWDKSYNFNVGAANLAQANFENATQIRARDMQQVGLNPLNLVGGAEGTSANFMSGSSPAGSASASAPSPVSPLSIADLFARFASMRHDSIENRKNRASAENVASIQAQSAIDVAQINAESSKYSADKNAETAYAVLEQRKAEFSENISLAFAEHDENVRANKVREELERIGLSNEQAKIKADKIAHDEEIRRAYEQLELEKQKELRAKTQEEKRIAAQKQRSWLMFIGDRIDNLVDIGKSIFLGSSSGSGHRRGIGFGNDEGW